MPPGCDYRWFEVYATVPTGNQYADLSKMYRLHQQLIKNTDGHACSFAINGRVHPEFSGEFLFKIVHVPANDDTLVQKTKVFLRSRGLRITRTVPHG
jgi:hypothetical protein